MFTGALSVANPHMAFAKRAVVVEVVPPPAAVPCAPQPSPRTAAAAEMVAGAIATVLQSPESAPSKESSYPPLPPIPPFVDNMNAPRSEYLEFFAPRSFLDSALPTKTAFEESLQLEWGARCMLERKARGIVDADTMEVTRI